MSWAWPLFKKAEIRHRNSTSLIISSFLLKIRDPNEEKATLCNSAYLFCWNRTSHKFFINSNSSFADMLVSDSNDGPALADPLETDIESDSCSFKDLNSVNLFCEYFRLLHNVITSSRLLILKFSKSLVKNRKHNMLMAALWWHQQIVLNGQKLDQSGPG